MKIEDLAEFMYLSHKQSLWETKQIETSSWKELEPYQREAWCSAATTAHGFLIPELV